MTKNEQPADERSERFSVRVYGALGRNGWRLPRTEAEVRAAEEWASRNPVRLPGRLADVPSRGPSPESGRVLGRYLRDIERQRSPEGAKEKDEGRSDQSLER